MTKLGFKTLFKVRKPGNGNAVQKSLQSEGKTPLNAGPLKANDFNSKDKKAV